jgi:hypothetical protein
MVLTIGIAIVAICIVGIPDAYSEDFDSEGQEVIGDLIDSDSPNPNPALYENLRKTFNSNIIIFYKKFSVMRCDKRSFSIPSYPFVAFKDHSDFLKRKEEGLLSRRRKYRMNYDLKMYD